MSNSKNTRKRRVWAAKRRAAQAENAQKTRPWENASGPKTPEGKAKAAQNALKSGLYTAEMHELRRVLRTHARLLKAITGSTCPPKGIE